MQEQLELLKKLQGIDQEVREVQSQLQRLQDEQSELNADAERIGAMIASLEQEMARLQTEQRELDRAHTIEQDNVAKAEGRLPAIKTQKEYVAVLKEIDTAKKLNKEIQDRILAKQLEIDNLDRDKAEKDVELTALSERNTARHTAIGADLQRLSGALDDRRSQRGELLDKLPVTLRKRYQTLIERRNGIAVVAARKGICLGCNMNLPPQLYNSLFSSKEVLTCPHCHRLLYLGQED